MHLFHSALVLLALGSSGARLDWNQSPAPVACATWEGCRDLALEAREADDPETFHDLAWRAVQTRRRRDPDLLFLLARAQSLSGRPHDALVTLQRLAAEFGVAHDVSRDEDFRRVRALPGWPDAQASIARVTEGTAAGARSAAGPEAAPDTADARARAVAAPAPKPDAAGTAGASAKTTAPRFDEVARFAAPRFAPGGLAYDAVSGRFVVGNLPERKLTIVAQGTNRAATLAGDAARLRGVRALEIDRRTGDLWVVSGGTDAGAIGSSELHKLQLVSGRVLSVYSAPAELGASRLVDVAVGRGIGVLALDAEGPRLLRPGSDGKALARAIDLPAGRVNSLAPADDGRHVYVAYDDRLVVVDLSARAVSPVKGNAASELRGIDRLRWQRGSLLALTTVNGTVRLIRLRLGKNGGRIASIDTLDSIAAGDAPLALDVLDDEVYYLVPGTPEAVIRRIQLK